MQGFGASFPAPVLRAFLFGRVLEGFRPGRVGVAELGVHLNLYVGPIAEAGAEQEGVEINPA